MKQKGSMFFSYTQRKICNYPLGPKRVIIEADDYKEANAIADEHGIPWCGYFYQIPYDAWCACHGDRWLAQIEGMGKHTLTDLINEYNIDMDDDVKVIYKDQ